MEHRLPIRFEFHIVQQPSRSMSKEVELKIKEETEKLLKVGFIKPTRHVVYFAANNELFSFMDGFCGCNQI